MNCMCCGVQDILLGQLCTHPYIPQRLKNFVIMMRNHQGLKFEDMLSIFVEVVHSSISTEVKRHPRFRDNLESSYF